MTNQLVFEFGPDKHTFDKTGRLSSNPKLEYSERLKTTIEKLDFPKI